MLVLSRRKGEEILIADNIHVAVMAVQGNRVRIGITAPGSVKVLRSELAPQQGPADHASSGGTSTKHGRPTNAKEQL